MAQQSEAKLPIEQLLLTKGLINQDQLTQALSMQQGSSEKLSNILVNLGFVDEYTLLETLAESLNLSVYSPDTFEVDAKLGKVIPENLSQKYNVAPIARKDNKLLVAMQDVSNVFMLDDLRLITGFEIEPVLATRNDILNIRSQKIATKAAATAEEPKKSDGNTYALDNGVVVPDDIDPELLSAAVTTGSSVKANPLAAGGGAMAAAMGGDAGSTETTEGDAEATGSTGGDSPSKAGMSDLAGMLDEMQNSPSATAIAASVAADNDTEVGEEVDVQEGPIIRMVNVLLQAAIKEKASDIHVEPDRRNMRIRYRIDGVLYEMMTLPKFVHPPLTSRLKIMGDMNIAERRIPQDGRFHIRHDGAAYDMRVSSLPTTFGEKIVMRILDQSSVLIGLNRLGFSDEMLGILEGLILQPNGMILTTGPTGSGKTTTLYSILNKINSPELNIVTAEDPVEYQLPGITQVHVNRKTGLTFPVAMHSFLRQDPDVIMVGEIRDIETATMAVEASLTGHLVFSTLHTNNAPATVTRLMDMGVEPFLISASVIGIIAQRLGRKLCEHCKEPIDVPLDLLSTLGIPEKEYADGEGTFFKPVGCEQCMHRGYRGRLGIYELMTFNKTISDLISRRAILNELIEAALEEGMISLLVDGVRKAKSGITSLEEVLRVVSTH